MRIHYLCSSAIFQQKAQHAQQTDISAPTGHCHLKIWCIVITIKQLFCKTTNTN